MENPQSVLSYEERKALLVHIASDQCLSEVDEFLLNSCHEKEDYLIQAIRGQNLNVVKFLVGQGADPQSGLSTACSTNQKEIVDFLISKGVVLIVYAADYLKADKNGDTPLDLAKRIGDQRVVQIIQNFLDMNEEFECPICTGDQNRKTLCILKCGHVFHSSCLSNRRKCYTCRAPIRVSYEYIRTTRR